MSLTEELKQYDVNVAEAVGRFMGMEAIYEKTLKKFPGAVESHEVEMYIKSGNTETATANAHTLKGVTGNLSMTKLYDGYVEIVSLLRGGESDKALTRLHDILPLQKSIVDCIKKYM